MNGVNRLHLNFNISIIVPQLSKYLKFEAVGGVLTSNDLNLKKEI